MESARTLDKGEVEVTGYFAHYLVANDGESQEINNNYGFRVGYGISDPFDIRVRYIRLVSAEEDGGGLNYLAVAPKYSLKEDIFAVTVPIGAYFDDMDDTWFLSPRLIVTYPFPNDKVDVSFSSKVDFYFEEDTDPTVGFNLGAGFSSDLNTWAFRPEIGLLFSTSSDNTAKYWSFGVGMTYNISK
jgi:hypothetical protein